MGKFNSNKLNQNTINSGSKLDNGQGLSAETINAIIEGILYNGENKANKTDIKKYYSHRVNTTIWRYSGSNYVGNLRIYFASSSAEVPTENTQVLGFYDITIKDANLETVIERVVGGVNSVVKNTEGEFVAKIINYSSGEETDLYISTNSWWDVVSEI